MDQRIDAQSLPPLPPGLIEITAPSAQATTATQGLPPIPAGLVEITAQDSVPPIPVGMEEIQSTDIPLYRGSGVQIGTMPKASAEKFGQITTALGEGLIAGPRSMIEPGIAGVKQAIKQPESILPSLREGLTWATTPEGQKEIIKAGYENVKGLVAFLPTTLVEFIKDPKRMIEEQPLDTIFLLSAVGGGAVGLASKIRAKVKLAPTEIEAVRKQLSDNEQAYAAKLEAVQAMPVTEPVKEAVPVVAEAPKTPEITPSMAPVIAVEPKTQAGGYTPTGETSFQRKPTANPIEKANLESYFEAQDAQVRMGRKLTPEERLKIDDEALRRHGLDPLKPLAEQVEGGKAPEVEILPEGEAYNIGIEREKRAELERDLARQSKIKRREIPEKPEAPAKSNLSTDQMAQINKIVDANTKSAWRAEDEPTREANRQALKTYLIENYKFKEGDVASGLLDAGNVQRAVNTLKGQFAKGELKTRALRETAVREQAMPEVEGKEGKIDVEPSTEQTVFGEESAPKGKAPEPLGIEPVIQKEKSVGLMEKSAVVFHDKLKSSKPKEADAFNLMHREGLPPNEAATKLGVSENTIRNWDKKWKKQIADDPEIRKIYDEAVSGLSGDEFSKLADEYGKELERKEGPVTGKVGLTVEMKGEPPATAKRPSVEFEPETEQRYQESRVLPKQRIVDKLSEQANNIRHGFTRVYEHLPRGARFVEALQGLKRLEKQPSITADKSVRTVDLMVHGLTKEQYDLFNRSVIVNDLLREVEAGREVPFGFDKASLESASVKLKEAIANDPKVGAAIERRGKLWDSLRDDYIYWRKRIGHDVTDTMNNPDYFRHKVIAHAEEMKKPGAGKKLRVHTGQEFLKKRGGSNMDILADAVQADHDVIHRMLYDIEEAKTLDRLGAKYNEWDKYKKIAKEKGVPIEKVIPEDYTKWQPRDGNTFYFADTIPAKIAEKIMEGEITDVGVVADSLRKSLALGGKRKTWIIPKELADTFDGLQKRRESSLLGAAFQKTNTAWKKWTLLSPRRGVKYFLRNLSGDADKVFVGNTHAFTKAPRAMKELWNVYFGDRPITGELKEYFERGGLQTTLQVQEMGELRKLPIFKNIYETGVVDKANLFKKYWSGTERVNNFRESTLRYGSYLDYLKQMESNKEGRPNNFGASIHDEIMGLSDIRDRAFRLSNELLGAYDEISPIGQTIREKIYPFWSWKELNTKSYVRMIKNAGYNDEAAMKVGQKFLAGAKASTVATLKVGKFAVKAMGLSLMLTAFNNAFFPDEENDLPESVKSRTHIVLGRDKDGKVRYFSRLGALGDFLEWFGMDGAQEYVKDFLNGKKTIKEIAVDMAKSPVNIVVSGVTPFAKVPLELLTRRTLFPDAFEPKTIRDRGEYLARQLALENEYRAISGKPSKPYASSLNQAIIYKADPLETAYHEMYDIKKDFMKSIGKTGGEGFYLSPAGDALYNMKLAHRYGDQELVKKYVLKYAEIIALQNRGQSDGEIGKKIRDGIKRSFESMHPMFGIKKDDRKRFIMSLDAEDRDTLVKAMKFYNDFLIGSSEFKPEE